MFESILERILQKALGDYVEGLDRNNLKLGVRKNSINQSNFILIFQFCILPKISIGLEWQHKLGKCASQEVSLR